MAIVLLYFCLEFVLCTFYPVEHTAFTVFYPDSFTEYFFEPISFLNYAEHILNLT